MSNATVFAFGRRRQGVVIDERRDLSTDSETPYALSITPQRFGRNASNTLPGVSPKRE